MKAIWVLYDETCGFCCRCAEWLSEQAAFIPLAVLPAGAPETKAHFPLRESGEKQELVVVDDEGGVYLGTDAWLMTLWALREWREWSVRLSKSENRGFARKVFELAGSWRHGLSKLFKVNDERELSRQLAALPWTESCDDGACALESCRSCGTPTAAGHSFCARCLAEALAS